MYIKKFTFNPFQENTYILYDDTKEAIVVDPGCYDRSEESDLVSFIEEKGLNVVRLLNTHAHIDHVFGNKFVVDQYQVELEMHELDFPILLASEHAAKTYGLNYTKSPEATKKIAEGDVIAFGETKLDVLHVPGHAPGHVVFVDPTSKVMIGGDVLFRGSIGRTDLPGGNHEQLLKMIKEKIFSLDPNIQVFSGHGPETTIGYEKSFNPFF